ncbi:DUF1800 family protein [Aliagarivorans marinus]|uniref:DUF1800 family protein n=1 Tax=Aliagarivorans marinus TaxID=561965 RepID=UPI0009FE9FD4|nr:DUF1800 family protein [Aliagarivorans marinus]
MKERIETYLVRISQVVLWLLFAMPLVAYSASDYGKLKLTLDARTSPSLAGYPAEHAIDGDINTQWLSDGSSIKRINYLVVAFEQETTVEEFRLLYDTSRYTDGLYLRTIADDGSQNVAVKTIGNWVIEQGTSGWISIVLDKPLTVSAPTVLSFQFHHHDDADGNRFYGDFNLNQIELYGTGELVDPGPIDPPVDLVLDYGEAFKLLTRATFGPSVTAAEELVGTETEDWLDLQLMAEPSYHLDEYLRIQQIRADINGSMQEHRNYRSNAWWGIALNSDDQLRQRVAFALSQLVVVSQNDAALVGDSRAKALANYYDIMVRHAFGSYRDLLLEVSQSPVMGLYLTFTGSKAESITGSMPDQNYAREIMQLFTLGELARTLDGGFVYDQFGDPMPAYYEEDVIELARVFTGWSVNGNDLLSPMSVNASHHDTEQKVVLGEVFKEGQDAMTDLEQALNLLMGRPETAVHVSSHLIRHLVTANPSQDYVARVAQVFADSQGDLAQVVSAILLDPAVQSGDVELEKAREPILVMAAIYRALNAQMGDNYPHHRDTSLGYGYDSQYSPEGVSFSQTPLGAPSVFNFYPASYVPNGPINDANQGVADELQTIGPVFALYDTPEFVAMSNLLYRKLGDATFDGSVDGKNNGRLYMDYSPLAAAWSNDKAGFLQLVADTFFAGEISDELLPILSDLYDELNTGKQSELRKLLWVALMSPEFLVQE